MKKILCLCLFVLLISPTDLFAQQTPFVQISGTVSKGNLNMPNVRVTVRNARGDFSRDSQTNIRGFFRFIRLPADNYYVEAEVPGSRWIKFFPKMTGTKSIEIDLDVDTEPGSISGMVTNDSDNKKPVENLKITLVDKMDPENKREIPVHSDGSYKIEDLLQGEYDLIFEAPGYKTKTKSDIDVKGRGDSKHKKIDVEIKK